MQIDLLQYNVYLGDAETKWPDEVNPIQLIHIFHKLIYGVNALDITLQDNANVVGSKFPLTEGTLLKLTWGIDLDLQVYKFRIAHLKRTVVNNVNIYRLWCYSDEPKWFTTTTTKAITGNSSDAITQIATDCNLKANVDTTSDKQTWHPFGQKFYVFARHVCRRGYASDKSLMMLAYTPNGLIYKDINAIDTNKPLALFSSASDSTTTPVNGINVPTYAITDKKEISKSGSGNLKGGYKYTVEDQNIDTNAENDQYSQVQVKNRVDTLQQNSKIQSSITSGKVHTGIIRSDNTHEKYNQAIYQNDRGLLMLRQGIEVVTYRQTKLQLLDCFSVQSSGVHAGNTTPSDNNTSLFDGPYICDGRIIRIAGNTYAEKLIGFREGVKL